MSEAKYLSPGRKRFLSETLEQAPTKRELVNQLVGKHLDEISCEQDRTLAAALDREWLKIDPSTCIICRGSRWPLH